MSTSEENATQLNEWIDDVPEHPPMDSRFRELDVMSDSALHEDPELTIIYSPNNLDSWLRFESRLLLDLKEVQ